MPRARLVMSGVGRDAAGDSDTDPYPLYTALDLNTIPWHVGSGGWGAQVTLTSPTLPTTTRSVTVNSTSEFNSEAAVAGTQITIGTGWAGASLVTINASDVDVIIPSGIAIGAIELGGWPRTTPIARVRIRGSTPGSHSGGRMGQFRAAPGTADIYTDIVLDGIDLNGDSNLGGAETNQAFRVESVTRIAVLNCRVIAAGYTWLGGAKHLVIANSNFYHGAATRAAAGFAEGWGIRNTRGPITIIDSRIQGTRYVNVRSQSTGTTEELLYIGRSVLANAAEGQTLWVWEDLDLGPYTGEGGLIENCDIYTHSAAGCGYSAQIRTSDVAWCEIKNNDFFGAGTSVFTQGIIDAAVKGGGVATGNTFSTMTTLPAWGGPGDPTAVPLPSGLTLIDGEGVCPYGP